MKKRVIDNSWSFVGADTKEFTHCYHSYPAIMFPQIARRLIEEFKPKNTNYIFDPYCGTGTTMLEAKLAKIESAGTDLNPMARLISVAKTTNYNIDKILHYRDSLSDDTFAYSFNKNKGALKLVDFKNIDFWFSRKSIFELTFLLNRIQDTIDEEYQDFFLVALSESFREVSYTRNSEFKLYRMPKHRMEQHKPDTFGIFFSKITRNIEGLKSLNDKDLDTYVHVHNFNTCHINPKEVLNREIDFVLCSPPYGDSKTTVAYGQFSRLSNQWLGVESASQIDNMLMGGNRKNDMIDFHSEYAKKELNEIKEEDAKRFIEVESFLNDYKSSIDNVAKAVRHKGRIAYVVGNRTVKGVQIPLDYITVELFEKNGFDHITTIVREIPNKRMPKANSPTNKKEKHHQQ
ncbi:MAG: DNA methyltransferase [Bacteroidales bacterium]